MSTEESTPQTPRETANPRKKPGSDDRPFRVIVPEDTSHSNTPHQQLGEQLESNEERPVDDLEIAYRRALETLEAVDEEFALRTRQSRLPTAQNEHSEATDHPEDTVAKTEGTRATRDGQEQSLAAIDPANEPESETAQASPPNVADEPDGHASVSTTDVQAAMLEQEFSRVFAQLRVVADDEEQDAAESKLDEINTTGQCASADEQKNTHNDHTNPEIVSAETALTAGHSQEDMLAFLDEAHPAEEVLEDEDEQTTPDSSINGLSHDEDETVGSLNEYFALTATPEPGGFADSSASGEEPIADREASSEADAIPSAPPTRLQPSQILEAALFVGGEPLTLTRMLSLLGDGFDQQFIERTLHELNVRYDDQQRPYELVPSGAGWQIQLRDAFEPVRHRVFGRGPKEIRLSQDAIEVLSLVAYRQPISREDVEELATGKPGAILSQLLRRELIQMERDEANKKHVRYRTTPRFLQVFGLGSLDELPQADELTFK